MKIAPLAVLLACALAPAQDRSVADSPALEHDGLRQLLRLFHIPAHVQNGSFDFGRAKFLAAALVESSDNGDGNSEGAEDSQASEI